MPIAENDRYEEADKTLQIFSESRQIVTNIALIGMGGLVLGTLCIMTAIILYSTVSVVREKN